VYSLQKNACQEQNLLKEELLRIGAILLLTMLMNTTCCVDFCLIHAQFQLLLCPKEETKSRLLGGQLEMYDKTPNLKMTKSSIE